MSYLDNSHARIDLVTRMEKDVARSFEGLAQMYRKHDDPVGICQHGQGGLHTDSGIIICPGMNGRCGRRRGIPVPIRSSDMKSTGVDILYLPDSWTSAVRKWMWNFADP